MWRWIWGDLRRDGGNKCNDWELNMNDIGDDGQDYIFPAIYMMQI